MARRSMRGAVLEFVKRAPKTGRLTSEIVEKTGLAYLTVTNHLRALRADGTLVSSPEHDGSRGRPENRWRVAEESAA